MSETGTRTELARAAGFWLLASLLSLFLFAASAPSPLYRVYGALWNFSPLTVTAIYAVYAGGALVGLLITGRLSDHLGRRPVVMGALVVQIASMGAFLLADGVGMLYAGRVLTGLGTGVATAALSAWLLDLQPPENPRFAGLVGGIAPLVGLAGGALVSSVLVEYGPNPIRLVFWVLAAAYAIMLAATFVIPDVVRRTPGWLRSLRPRVGVPSAARPVFVASVPSLIAMWALAGLYLSLGPSLAASLIPTENRVAGGLVIVVLAGAGAVASTAVRGIEPRLLLLRGSVVIAGGVGVTLLAVAFDSTAGLYLGSGVAGLGLGPAFSGVVRSLAPLAPPEQRNALFASIYIATYLSFSLPAIIAGVATTEFGLKPTTYGYGLVVMALAAMTTVAISRPSREPPSG